MPDTAVLSGHLTIRPTEEDEKARDKHLMDLHVEHDTLPFCHLSTPQHPAIGWTIGLLQFVPWFLSPLLFIRPPHAWTWRRERFNTILFIAAKGLVALIVVLQVHIAWRVPDPGCTDIFGAVHGFPSAAATLVGFYLAVATSYQVVWLKRASSGRQEAAYQAWYAIVAFGLSLAALSGLYLNGLNTAPQIAGSALLGILYGLTLMAIVHFLLMPLFLEPLQHPVHSERDERSGQDGSFEARVLTYLFGAHDSFLVIDQKATAHA